MAFRYRFRDRRVGQVNLQGRQGPHRLGRGRRDTHLEGRKDSHPRRGYQEYQGQHRRLEGSPRYS